MQKHWNIQLEQAEDRQHINAALAQKQYPACFAWMAKKRVQVVNPKAILTFIDDELKHDNNTIRQRFGQGLETMSSGERKRAYLLHVLDLQPEVLVLDHFFDNLDTQAKAALAERILAQKHSCDIVSFYSRQQDALPGLAQFFVFRANSLIESTANHSLAPTPAPRTTNTATLPPAVDQAEELPSCLVAFKDVSVSYRDKCILNRISWQIHAGEFWHLRGPNGSGKTTLLSMVVGDNPKAYGQALYLFGKKKGSGESIWDIKRRIGYFTSSMTFQFWRMQPIRDMIISGFYDSIGLYTTPGDYQVQLANQWLQFMGLAEYATKPFVKMSLCHQRMVMIARAMVKHPPLLILDEPSVDLDEKSAALVIDLINRIAKQSSTAVVYVSHRDEKGLVAQHTFSLTPSPQGSSGQITTTRQNQAKK